MKIQARIRKIIYFIISLIYLFLYNYLKISDLRISYFILRGIIKRNIKNIFFSPYYKI